MMRAGVLKLNFFARELGPRTDRVEKHAAVTLSMPLTDFADIVEGLNTLLQEMKEKGSVSSEQTT